MFVGQHSAPMEISNNMKWKFHTNRYVHSLTGNQAAEDVNKRDFIPARCNECSETLSSVYKLRIHIDNVHDQPKECKMCNKTFSKVSSLNDYVRALHSTDMSVCEICGKSFHIKSNLNRHVKNIHENPTPKREYCKSDTSKFEAKTESKGTKYSKPFGRTIQWPQW